MDGIEMAIQSPKKSAHVPYFCEVPEPFGAKRIEGDQW